MRLSDVIQIATPEEMAMMAEIDADLEALRKKLVTKFGVMDGEPQFGAAILAKWSEHQKEMALKFGATYEQFEEQVKATLDVTLHLFVKLAKSEFPPSGGDYAN